MNSPTETKLEDGTLIWHLNDKCHRDGEPAIIRPDGSEEWYQHGKCHRDDGPAYIKMSGYNNGRTEVWYQHGVVHRDGAPAIFKPGGTVIWYYHGQCHRDDGPAVVHKTDRNTYEQYWLRGKQLQDTDTFLLKTIKVREDARVKKATQESKEA